MGSAGSSAGAGERGCAESGATKAPPAAAAISKILILLNKPRSAAAGRRDGNETTKAP